MKVILLEDVKTLGKKGQIIEVNDGYARNFVLPKKLGMEASNKNLNDLKLQKAKEEKIAKELLEHAQTFAKELSEKHVVVTMKAGEGGRVFGSISSKEIAKAALDQFQIELDKKKIVMDDHIKNFGTFQVGVKLHPQVTATLTVLVKEEK
jgi:large subunit ribosomal protein L9